MDCKEVKEKEITCPVCNLKIKEFNSLKCPRCNSYLLAKCSECNKCSIFK